MALVVQKYGGTSVASVERIYKVAQRVIQSKESGNSLVVVLSAMGKTTDHLLKMATDIEAHPEGRELDMLVSTGEQVAAALLSIALRKLGCEAVSLAGWQAGILTEAKYTDAKILSVDPLPVRKHLAEGRVVVVAGYQGVTEDGDITTLGRGGSDTSAVALAGSLNAALCEIYTDVEGVYTADPRAVPSAQKIRCITYSDMLELARHGAGVLHPRSVEEAQRKQVPLKVRSSFTADEGTQVRGEGYSVGLKPFCGIAHQADMAILSVENEGGVGSDTDSSLKTFFKHQGIQAEVYKRDDRSTSFCLPAEQVKAVLSTLQENRSDIGIDSWQTELNLSKVNVIGAKQSAIHELALRAGQFPFPIRWLRQNTKGMSCIVPQAFSKQVMQAFHTVLNLDAKLKEVAGS